MSVYPPFGTLHSRILNTVRLDRENSSTGSLVIALFPNRRLTSLVRDATPGGIGECGSRSVMEVALANECTSGAERNGPFVRPGRVTERTKGLIRGPAGVCICVVAGFFSLDGSTTNDARSAMVGGMKDRPVLISPSCLQWFSRRPLRAIDGCYCRSMSPSAVSTAVVIAASHICFSLSR